MGKKKEERVGYKVIGNLPIRENKSFSWLNNSYRCIWIQTYFKYTLDVPRRMHLLFKLNANAGGI